MRRFRTQWLALFGALVILSMSLSTAFGAKPTTTTSPFQNFGQQVSAFVHVLMADNDEDGDEDSNEDSDEDQDEDSDEDQDEDSDECETPSDDGDTEDGDTEDGDTEDGDTEDGDTEDGDTEDGDTDEDAAQCEDTDEDTDEDSEDGDETADEESEFKNHGQCVAEVARSADVGENGTHGWAVALAAQVTCWLELNGDDEEDEDEADSDSDTDSDEDQDADVESSADKTHGKSEAAHQRKLDRGSGKPEWAGAKLQDRGAKVHGGHGKGHGRQ